MWVPQNPRMDGFLMENLVKMDDARVYHGVRSKRRESPGEDILNTVKERNRSFNVQFSGAFMRRNLGV